MEEKGKERRKERTQDKGRRRRALLYEERSEHPSPVLHLRRGGKLQRGLRMSPVSPHGFSSETEPNEIGAEPDVFSSTF